MVQVTSFVLPSVLAGGTLRRRFFWAQESSWPLSVLYPHRTLLVNLVNLTPSLFAQ